MLSLRTSPHKHELMRFVISWRNLTRDEEKKLTIELFEGNINLIKLECDGQCLLLHDQISNRSVKTIKRWKSSLILG